jgi:hypothetical protein
MLPIDDNALNEARQNVCKMVVATFTEIPLKPLILIVLVCILLGQSVQKSFRACSLGK